MCFRIIGVDLERPGYTRSTVVKPAIVEILRIPTSCVGQRTSTPGMGAGIVGVNLDGFVKKLMRFTGVFAGGHAAPVIL